MSCAFTRSEACRDTCVGNCTCFFKGRVSSSSEAATKRERLQSACKRSQVLVIST